MYQNIPMNELLALPVQDRLRLIGEIWDSITAIPEAVVLTDEQRKELDTRLEAYRKDPQKVIPWEEVKACIMNKP